MKVGHYRPLFLYFCLFKTFDTNVPYKSLPITGFKPRTSGVGSDRSTNLATTTAQEGKLLVMCKSRVAIIDCGASIRLTSLAYTKSNLKRRKIQTDNEKRINSSTIKSHSI